MLVKVTVWLLVVTMHTTNPSVSTHMFSSRTDCMRVADTMTGGAANGDAKCVQTTIVVVK